MTTDHAAAAAEEIVNEWGIPIAPRDYPQAARELAAIIRQHYAALPPDPQDAALTAERESLLRRAVGALESAHEWVALATVETPGHRPSIVASAAESLAQCNAVLTDAAAMGVTGDAT